MVLAFGNDKIGAAGLLVVPLGVLRKPTRLARWPDRASSAKTGKIGDGKIFVYGLDHVVRIRTSETDADAI